MDLVRADLDIASHYDALAGADVSAITGEIRREHALAKQWVSTIKGQAELLDNRPQMQRSVLLRAPYIDPIHLMQVDLLRRWRAGRLRRRRAPRCAARERVGHRPRPAGDRLMAQPERSVVVYCASSRACEAEYHDEARRLGEILATAGCAVVYGGGRAGSMGALAEGALAKGGRVVGVIPKFMMDLEWGHDDLSELHVVEDMRTRKHEMLTRASAVVALAGGTGTLEELFEAITLKRLGLFLGPIVIVNTKGYYDPLIAQLQACDRPPVHG